MHVGGGAGAPRAISWQAGETQRLTARASGVSGFPGLRLCPPRSVQAGLADQGRAEAAGMSQEPCGVWVRLPCGRCCVR